MKRPWLLILLSLFTITTIHGQSAAKKSVIDSLLGMLARSQPDTNRVNLLSELSIQYLQLDANQSLTYANQGHELAQQLHFSSGEADCLRRSGIAFYLLGRYPEALDRFQKALVISEGIHHAFGIAAGLGHIGNIYAEQGDIEKARDYFHRSLAITLKSKGKNDIALAYKRLAETFLEAKVWDSAWYYLDKAYVLLEDVKNTPWTGGVLKDFGDLYLQKGNLDSAMTAYRNGIIYAMKDKNSNNLSDLYLGVAKLFDTRNKADSAISYALRAFSYSKINNYAKGQLLASKYLAVWYEPMNETASLRYHKISAAVGDSLFNKAKLNQVQNLLFLDQERKREIETTRIAFNNQLRLYALLAAAFVFLLVAILLYRNNRLQQKANARIQKAYADLEAAQAQLVQSEKMASLGELTAGIAHEIQNPLNFVNNFSEINTELIDELQAEAFKGNIGEVTAIAKDIRANEEKINQHGKRADAIVKGMLQHSQKSTGEKQYTDINALADECLRLSYHGFIAKDKNFNTALKTAFDPSLQKINIIPQDIGRVLLNIYNNAFYAAKDTVEVSTRKSNNHILIAVTDNGKGIPLKIIDKIFQPFFTTKPTGEGTGLGLSLSYDIVKAHGGEIKVDTKENAGTTFIIQLPAL